MSERILKALMQLFAIIAKVDYREDGSVTSDGRDVVELFLKKQLNTELVQEYLALFDNFLSAHHKTSQRKDGSRKRTSLNSVKVLRICTQINEELTQRQKIIVLLRLLEFINSDEEVTEQEDEFVTTVAETFNITDDEYRRINHFVLRSNKEIQDSPFLLYVARQEQEGLKQTKYIHSDGISGELRILQITSVGIYIIRYFGTKELFLNGQLITNERNNILTNGSSIRSAKVQPIYYSDIIASFLSDTTASRLVFKVENIQYKFKGGKIGLHNMSFSEESGKLIGIMGGSGAGKSTLLNVLNGNYKPTEGTVSINGIDIYTDSDQIEGVIGHISQDDLLIEELTVFQNLFYNAKLCFSSMNDAQIAKLVLQMLNSIGLYETRDLKVGSPLSKTISGGQRKRLNIALELIREPSVLFVDEPTSGLSSRDSENIMDLLKELALKGKLLFVVIHQPSSDIFKMFDKLMILDQGGLPIYYGNPVDAVIYFKKQVNHVNAEESECYTCGNVNPEQIFNIIESKVVDEYGNLTQNRKVSPKEWNKSYEKNLANKEKVAPETEIPESTFKPPGKLKQFGVFLTRDVLSKLTNRQYILVNLLEAPILATILSFFVKFYHDETGTTGYIFRENENLPQYLFMSVVVALFIGLTVSAEEIIRDQRILKREQFLNLSRGSYLFSKITIMFTISAIQTLLFVLLGNFILEIKGLTLDYWLILFSASCFANMLGLNISASFNSAKVIYILIPFLIIPQLLFSGVIVKFDKLIPTFASQSSVPLIGNVMASRWAYEALAVTQFKDNEFEKNFFKEEMLLKSYNWKKDVWYKSLDKRRAKIRRQVVKGEAYDEFDADLEIIRNELKKQQFELDELRSEGYLTDPIQIEVPYIGNLVKDKVDTTTLDLLKKDLDMLFEFYKNEYKRIDKLRDQKTIAFTSDTTKNKEFLALKETYENESLSEFVTNKNNFGDVSVVEDGQIIQKSNPIYLLPFHKGLFGAHFYAPQKRIFGVYVDTFWANTIVLWMMSILLIITLYFDLMRKLFEGIGLMFSYLPFLNKKDEES